jgi:transposase
MELSRATWLVATFAPRLGDKINVHAIRAGSYVGLTPATYDSGDTKHDQGINKAGNTRARVTPPCNGLVVAQGSIEE